MLGVGVKGLGFRTRTLAAEMERGGHIGEKRNQGEFLGVRQEFRGERQAEDRNWSSEKTCRLKIQNCQYIDNT